MAPNPERDSELDSYFLKSSLLDYGF